MRASDGDGEPAAGDAAAWDQYFTPGGPWERNGGRRQTRSYARAFCGRVAFDPAAPFTLLDLGCALGEGLRIFRRRYPRAVLSGMDISPVAISRCQTELGDVATFAAGGADDVAGHYDIIYTSHVLEHFVDYAGAARRLLSHCDRLCIVVPFARTIGGRPLGPDPSRQHQHSFFEDSFAFLVEEGEAASIATHIVSCPGARPLRKAIARYVINAVRRLVGKAGRDLSIIYDVRGRGRG